MPQEDSRGSGSDLDQEIWEGFMEKLACELRLKDRQRGVQEAEAKTYFLGQKEKDEFQAEETRGVKEQECKMIWVFYRRRGTQ